MALNKILTLSTVHVKPETMQRILDEDFEWLACYEKSSKTTGETYGAFVLVDSAEPDDADLTEDLAEVMNYAMSFDALWIEFDNDADEIGELPRYITEWDEAAAKGVAPCC